MLRQQSGLREIGLQVFTLFQLVETAEEHEPAAKQRDFGDVPSEILDVV